jgi:hypothetical protein
MAGCDVDLTAPPFGVVAGDPSAGPGNTAAINSAITTYSGKRARLVLPAGDVYVDQANTNSNWSIKFPVGVSDLALVGHGMFSTRIVVQGIGDGGTWHGIMVDGASRIELANFGIQMGTVANPDPGDQNHLISLLSLSGLTSDIVGHHLFFGQAIGDGLRILGDVSRVTNVRFTDFVMRMAGIGHGSRSGVALQRGWQAVELGNFYIDGVKNSPIDMEPTGSNPLPMAHLNIHDGFIDQSLGQSDVAFSIGGVSHGERAQHIRVSDVTILEGRVLVVSTDSLRVRNMTIVATARSKAPLFAVRQINNDLRLENLYLERLKGSDDGNVLDIENAGSSTTVDGGVFVQGVLGRPLTFDGTADLRIRGPRIQYDGTSPLTRDAINVLGGIGDADNIQIHDVQVSSSTGKLRSAVRLAPRSGRSMTNVRITDIHCAGSAANGVYLSYHPSATVDSSPVLSGIDNRDDPVWKQVDHNDNTITTIYPVIAGNPGGVCEMVGQTPPEHAVPAIQGTIFTHQDGDTTARYYKSTGTGNTGWSPPMVVP